MEELIKRLDKSYIRVKTKDKVPQILDWVNYKEGRSIKQLLEENGEYGLRTGTKTGNYWFCVLDIDQKGWTKIFKSWQSYIDKRIGDFCSKGRQVVGVGSKHISGITYDLVKNGKWFMKLENIEELREKLGKYEIELR